MSIIKTVTRYHDFSYGHRILAPGPCSRLHGHNARVYFTFEGEVDSTGHIIDFSEIKESCCEWLERNWDHRMLLSHLDPLTGEFARLNISDALGITILTCNPTAENLTTYLFSILKSNFNGLLNAKLVSIKWEETRKCSVTVTEK